LTFSWACDITETFLKPRDTTSILSEGEDETNEAFHKGICHADCIISSSSVP